MPPELLFLRPGMPYKTAILMRCLTKNALPVFQEATAICMRLASLRLCQKERVFVVQRISADQVHESSRLQGAGEGE